MYSRPQTLERMKLKLSFSSCKASTSFLLTNLAFMSLGKVKTHSGKVIFMRIYIDLALLWTKGVGSDPLLSPSVLPFEGTIDPQVSPLHYTRQQVCSRHVSICWGAAETQAGGKLSSTSGRGLSP